MRVRSGGVGGGVVTKTPSRSKVSEVRRKPNDLTSHFRPLTLLP